MDAAELLGVNKGSKSVSDSSKAFVNFAEAMIVKLDLSKVWSSKDDKSFILGIRHMVKVKASFSFLLSFFLFFLLSV